MNSQLKHLSIAGAIWVVLTAIGEVLAFADIYPTAAAEWADESDDVFRFLMILGVPVFTFVIAVLSYAILRFRSDGQQTGPSSWGTGMFPRAWLAVTSGLAIFVMIYPGLIGVAELRNIDDDNGLGEEIEEDALEIHVDAFQWSWRVEYIEEGITLNAALGDVLTLPVDRQVLFRIDSSDVVHSFWIPAFRMKIDAIPGRTTSINVVPVKTGDSFDDAAFRLQCAELCGLDHTDMAMAVQVVEPDEFDAWLAEQGQ